MHWLERFDELARHQEGLVARFHLPPIDATARHWREAIRRGRYRELSPRVIAAVGSPPSDPQRVLAAVLDASPGAILHGPSTLGWCELRGYDLRSINVARSREMSHAVPTLAVVHYLRAIRAHHVTVIRGVPTEVPLRAIWAEAARYASPRLFEVGLAKIGRLLDDAHRKGLAPWEALHELVNDIRRRGRAGTVLMRTLAEERLPGTSPTESRNEDEFEKILANAGLTPLRRQVTVGDTAVIGRADFRDEPLPFIVEVNSLTFHTTPSDRAADQRRYRRYNDAGFTVGVVWEPDLWSRPLSVLELVRNGRHQAGTGEHTILHTPSCPWPLEDP